MYITNFQINCNTKKLSDSLITKFQNTDGVRLFSSADTLMIFWEDYSWRIGSTLMVTIALDISKLNESKLLIVSGGGTKGLVSFNWGAEESRAGAAYEIISNIVKDLSGTIIATSE